MAQRKYPEKYPIIYYIGPAVHIPSPPFTIWVRVLYKHYLLRGSGYGVKKSVPPMFTISVRLVSGYLLYGSCRCTGQYQYITVPYLGDVIKAFCMSVRYMRV